MLPHTSPGHVGDDTAVLAFFPKDDKTPRDHISAAFLLCLEQHVDAKRLLMTHQLPHEHKTTPFLLLLLPALADCYPHSVQVPSPDRHLSHPMEVDQLLPLALLWQGLEQQGSGYR